MPALPLHVLLFTLVASSQSHTQEGNHSLRRYKEVIVDYFHEQRQ